MIPASVLARYDAEFRADPPPDPTVRYMREAGVVREVGRAVCIIFADLAGRDPDEAIAAQSGYATGLRLPIEWKVYGHDRPPDLGRRLGAAGFTPEAPETLMAFDLGETPADAPAASAGAHIHRVGDRADLEAWADVAGASFGRDDRWRVEVYGPRLADPTVALYLALADGRPVAAARLELPAGRSIATIWGGGTLPAYRGRGIYRRLVWARAVEARRRGYRYLAVEARDTSRPILERLGFQALTTITEWTRPAPEA